MRQRLEYALVWIMIKLVGSLPRPLARFLGILLAWTIYLLHGRLRKVGLHNLSMAMPEKSLREHRRILRGVFISLGRQLGEACLFPRYTRENVTKSWFTTASRTSSVRSPEGRECYFSPLTWEAWELSSFSHSLQGYPLHIVIRPLDNVYLDRLIREYRTMHGNSTVDKDDFVRGLLAAMKNGETVGILMDTNMTPPQGVFVDFFGIPACTASGMARIALRTDAAVVPGFTVWDPVLRKYRFASIRHVQPDSHRE